MRFLPLPALPPKASQPCIMQPLLFKLLPRPRQLYLWPHRLAQRLKVDLGGRKAAPPLFLLICALGHLLSTSASALLCPLMAAKTQADARKSREGIRYRLTPHRTRLLVSPLQNPAPCLGGDTKQSHPHQQQPALYLPITIKHAAAANTGTSAKSPCKQFWSELLGTCNIPFGPSWIFSVLLVGWQTPMLCASALP